MFAVDIDKLKSSAAKTGFRGGVLDKESLEMSVFALFKDGS